MKEQNIACAELEGWTRVLLNGTHYDIEMMARGDETRYKEDARFNYNSIDALHRIVCGLDDVQIELYKVNLKQVMSRRVRRVDLSTEILRPMAHEVREALLKATSRWETKEGGE